MAMFGAIGVTAEPASAAQTCTGATAANLCLTINRLDNGLYDVNVSIDMCMSLAEAQEYIDDPGNPAIAEICGDDSGKLASTSSLSRSRSLGQMSSGSASVSIWWYSAAF
jgi:hypothetical protein